MLRIGLIIILITIIVLLLIYITDIKKRLDKYIAWEDDISTEYDRLRTLLHYMSNKERKLAESYTKLLKKYNNK